MSEREEANRYARTAREGFEASARTFAHLEPSEWNAPTGCAKWDMRALAGHIVGEAVWFANVVRGITEGEAEYPLELYDELKQLEPTELARRTVEAGRQIEESVAAASDEQLETPADVGWAKMPLWRATRVSAQEAVLHEWDTRAKREEHGTIPVRWADVLMPVLLADGAMYAHHNSLRGNEGIFALEIEGQGPYTMEIGRHVTLCPGEPDRYEARLALTPDQFVRLITGRLTIQDELASGPGDTTARLERVFAGIANG